MSVLQEEKTFLLGFKEKLVSNNDLSKEELLEMCHQFEETIELASVSMKIINRLRLNYTNVLNNNRVN